MRDRRDEANVRPGQPLRDRRVRELARPDRAVRAGCARCRCAAACRRGPRRPGLDILARARARDPDGAAVRRRRGRVRAPWQTTWPAPRVLRGRDGAGRRGPRARGRGSPRGGRGDRRGGQPAPHRLWPRDLLHRRAGGGVGEPRPLRRDPLRAATRRRRRARQLPRDARPAVRSGGQAPDHARDVRAVGWLLRRLLPEGSEGADADQGRLRQALGARLRCPRGADVADGRVPLRRPAGRPRLDVPVGRLHAAGQHGRAARVSRSRAGCPTASLSGSS